jgi:hypothetical protein
VISQTTSFSIGRRRAHPSRALACLLLLLIAYGATVQVVHSHGRVSAVRAAATAISDAGGSQSSRTGQHSHQECATCQFQQQLFNGLVDAPLFASALATQIAAVSAPAVPFLSISATPQRGRAPPVNL